MDKCPHCGTRLARTVDAFCPECREPLDEEIAETVRPEPSVIDPFTSKQWQYLEFLEKCGPHNESQRLLFRTSIRSWFWLFLVCSVVALVAVLLDREHLIWFAAGIFVGIVAREHKRLLETHAIWPAFSAVVDWSRVSRLVAEHRQIRDPSGK